MLNRSRATRAALVAAISVLMLMLSLGTANAAVRDGLVLRADCEGFTSLGGSVKLDRDNTGAGREQFIITAFDGNNNVIFAPTSESFIVGSRISFPVGAAFAWTSVPTANPIVVRVYSPSGNGLAEQTIFSAVGTCAGLPTVAENSFSLLRVLDGSTSPSVALNAQPPRPFGDRGLIEGQKGYLVVDTAALNLRSGDGVEYSVVGRVSGGSFLAVLGRNADASWWYVQVDDIIGWVNNEFVKIRGDLTGTPEIPVRGEPFLPRVFVYTAQMLKTLPRADALNLCEIAGGLEYYVVGRNSDTSWYELQATCGDVPVTGWIDAELVAIRNPGGYVIPLTE